MPKLSVEEKCEAYIMGIRPCHKMFKYFKEHNLNLWVVFFFLIYVILILKYMTLRHLEANPLFAAYSILVSIYILSRFAIAYFYHNGNSPGNETGSNDYPTISFVIPAKNEGANIKQTILRAVESDYPRNLFKIIAINDGSSDNTLEEMLAAKAIADHMGVNTSVVNWQVNRGKREGMAEGLLASNADIVIFIDSDSFVEKDTARKLVRYFNDPRVAAVTGHGLVANENTNFITKMQAVRYYVAFKGYKSAEAIFGSVTCCSGCCSAYRKSAVLEILESWRNQSFLGIPCTYGDDRSLTNYLLEKGYSALYAPEAVVHTVVPDTFKKFMRQQLRWKKSWVRESLKSCVYMWRKNILMSISFYLGIILPLAAPLVVTRALIWLPIKSNYFPWPYLVGLFLMALIYGLYYYIYTKSDKWLYGVIFSAFYTLILIWQLPWAILNLRDARWGTR